MAKKRSIEEALTEEPKQEAPPAPEPAQEPEPLPAGNSAGPVDADAIAAARESRAIAAETGKRPRGRPRKVKGDEPAQAAAPGAPTLTPEQQAAMTGSLVTAYEMLVSLLVSFARVPPIQFTAEERPVVGSSIVSCVELYLPAGAAKHMPALILALATSGAIQRSISQQQAARDAQEIAQ